ncbi:hypothetical protein DAEQUDRAFT_731619, partial [Daedalea quercina L-15889]
MMRLIPSTCGAALYVSAVVPFRSWIISILSRARTFPPFLPACIRVNSIPSPLLTRRDPAFCLSSLLTIAMCCLPHGSCTIHSTSVF